MSKSTGFFATLRMTVKEYVELSVNNPKQPAVYILVSKRNGTLYIGVTSQLPQRIYQHKMGLVEGFTKKYDIKTLVYFELCDDMVSAITREKSLKGIARAKKIALIESQNPEWVDLADKFELFIT